MRLGFRLIGARDIIDDDERIAEWGENN